MKYDRKVVISGHIVELYDYEHTIFSGYDRRDGCSYGRAAEVSTSEEQKKENRNKVMSRAKKTVRRLINANVYKYKDSNDNIIRPKFVTLTFKDLVTDVKKANYEFKKFIKRLNYKLGYKVKYVTVIEFQQRGAIHYHVVFFNLIYMNSNDLADLWKNGFIKINAIDDCDNVGAYVSKYMTKDNDEDKLRGEKCYFSSRGLFKPVEIKDKKKIDDLVGRLSDEKLVYENSFDNDYTGNIIYKQYNLKKNNKA